MLTDTLQAGENEPVRNAGESPDCVKAGLFMTSVSVRNRPGGERADVDSPAS